jgi:hypothetical protein
MSQILSHILGQCLNTHHLKLDMVKPSSLFLLLPLPHHMSCKLSIHEQVILDTFPAGCLSTPAGPVVICSPTNPAFPGMHQGCCFSAIWEPTTACSTCSLSSQCSVVLSAHGGLKGSVSVGIPFGSSWSSPLPGQPLLLHLWGLFSVPGSIITFLLRGGGKAYFLFPLLDGNLRTRFCIDHFILI